MNLSYARSVSTRAAIIFCSAAALLSADTVVLRSGETVQGVYMGGTARQVQLSINGQIRSFDIGQVQSVIFSDPAYQSRSQAPYPPPNPQYPPSNQQYPPPSYPPPSSTQASQYPPPSSSQYPPPQAPYPQSSSSSAPRDSGSSPTGITIPADTQITVRMIDAVNSDTSRLGQTYRASVDEPVYVNGQQVIPRGADVWTKLVADQQSGKIEGRTVLTLALSTISINGNAVDVTSSEVRTESSSRGNRSAGVIGGTAALGAIIGAIAGGGKGAAIGAGSGAAVGTGAEVMTAGQKVKIPSETRLTFKLQMPVQL